MARKKQRENKKKAKEEYLNLRTEWGISDPTPSKAVTNIINKTKAL